MVLDFDFLYMNIQILFKLRWRDKLWLQNFKSSSLLKGSYLLKFGLQEGLYQPKLILKEKRYSVIIKQ